MKTSCIIAAVALLTLPVSVFAQGLYGDGFNARSAALGGVYVESSLLSAMAVNPAGLALVPRRMADESVLGMFARGSYSNAVDAKGTLRPSIGVLPYGALASRLRTGSRWTVGVSFTPETTMSAKWRYADVPGTAGATWGLRDHQSQILAVRTAFGFGVQIKPWLMVGGAAGVVYNQNTLVTPYIFQFHPVLRGLKTALDLRTSGTGWNGTVGVLVQPRSSFTWGFAYKTQTAIETHGEANGTLDRQFAAIGLAARPDYRYQAQVDNTLPQSATTSLHWRAHPRLAVTGQMEWINWSRAFKTLPVNLTNGNNADVNGLLGKNSILDGVPLNWRDQWVWRAGAETPLTEALSFRAGAFFTQNPVPGSTLTPLTAVIMKQALSTGLGYQHGAWRLDAAYTLNLPAEGRVGTSALAGSEYSNSRIRLTLHAVMLTAGVRF